MIELLVEKVMMGFLVMRVMTEFMVQEEMMLSMAVLEKTGLMETEAMIH